MNIYARQSSTTVTRRRDRLTNDLLSELTAWNPREWITAIKRWHRGPLGALTLVHLNVIAELEMHGQMSMGQLADALDVSVASATGIVSRMEHRGLVERRHAGSDRRVVMVGPTATGSKIFGEMEARRRARLAKLLGHLTDDEMAGFATGLRALRKARSDDAAADLTSGADAPGGANGNGNGNGNEP